MRLVPELQRTLRDDMTLCLDRGSCHIWQARHLYSFRPRHVLITNGQQLRCVGPEQATQLRFVTSVEETGERNASAPEHRRQGQ